MSGLEINYEGGDELMETYDPKERLALTEDGRVVPEGHADARWLYAIPGRPIPMADAIKHGLVSAKAPSAAPESETQESAAESKPAKKPTARRRKA